MHRFASFTVALTILLVSGVSQSPAAPVEPAHVPQQADWLMHLDFQAMRDSEIGAFAQQHLEQDPRAAAARAYVETKFGIDLMQDVLDMTLFGQGDDRDRAVMTVSLAASFDKLLEHERQREGAAFRQATHRDYTIYSWIPRKLHDVAGRNYLAIHGEENDCRIVMSQNQTMVKRTLDVMDGLAPSAAADEAGLGALLTTEPGMFSQFVAENLSTLVEHGPKSVVFRNISSAVLLNGEIDGQWFVTTGVTATDAQTAAHMANLVHGTMALARLHVHELPDAELLQQVINAVQVQQVGESLTVDVRVPAAVIIEIAQQHADRLIPRRLR